MPRMKIALALAITCALAAAAPVLAVQSTPETYQQLLAQVNGNQVRSALIVPTKNEVRVRLESSKRYTTTIPAGQQPQLEAALRQHGATVHVRGAKKASSHIRYRYIALAVIVLGGVAALAYYLLRGRPSPPPDAGEATGRAPPTGAVVAEPAAGADPAPGGGGAAPASGAPPAGPDERL